MNRKIGAHVSASGGLYKAIERAHAIGANCVQLFSGSPRVWGRKDLKEFSVDKMFSKQKELAVEPIFTHSLYLVNLATDKPELLEKSFNALKYDLEFDSLIKGSGIIVHLGSHQGRGWEAMKEQVAQQISRLLKVTPKDSTFLIENSAGQKGKLCSELDEIRWLLDRVEALMANSNADDDGEAKNNEVATRLGWCFDTCHAHAAGYVLGKVGGNDNKNENGEKQDSVSVEFGKLNKFVGQPGLLSPKSAIDEIEKYNLWDALKCIHVNDSRDDFDSGRDRHANLGEGNISEEDFRYFLNDKRLESIPLLLEVPGEDKKGPDRKNIKKLHAFCNSQSDT